MTNTNQMTRSLAISCFLAAMVTSGCVIEAEDPGEMTGDGDSDMSGEGDGDGDPTGDGDGDPTGDGDGDPTGDGDGDPTGDGDGDPTGDGDGDPTGDGDGDQTGDPFPDPAAWYKLQTEFQGQDMCLEGNQADSPDHGGNAFMNDCQDVSGQMWQFVPVDVEGMIWYRMKTLFQGEDKCLEGNQAESDVHDGAAFMNDCQDVSGQLWQVMPNGDWYKLQTMFQGPDECLEGNEGDSPVHNGSAFMDVCQDVSGQNWALNLAP